MVTDKLIQTSEDILDAISANETGRIVVTREPVKGDSLHSGQRRVPCGTFTNPEKASARARFLTSEGFTVYVRFVTVSEICLREWRGK